MIDNTFLLKELLGIGGSSKVYNAISNEGEEVALKVIRKDKGYSDELACKIVENEHLLSAKLGQHPNLVNILGYNSDGSAQLADGVHSINYLIMEKCKNGALSSLIRQTGPLEENIAKFLFMQICGAVKFIHTNYAHMDIKLENILLDDFFNIKLADLGTVIDISQSMGYTDKRRGTPHYMAPEVRNKKSEEMIDARLSDVYSLGVCLHLLLTGEFPDKKDFSDETSIETECSDDLTGQKISSKKGAIQNLSPEAKDLLEEILQEDAFFRIGLDEAMNHPWLQNCDFSAVQDSVYLEMKARVEYMNLSKSE